MSETEERSERPGAARWRRRGPPQRLGQHFLADRNVARKIVDRASLTAADDVIEVGPGRGILTALMAERAGRVTAIEIDPGLVADLEHRFAGRERVRIVQGDFLSWEIPAPEPGWGKAKIVANIPYQISSPIIEKLVRSRDRLSICVIMFQREVAARILAEPGTREYSSLTVCLRLYAEATLIQDVHPACFSPRPRVFSSVLRLRFRDSLAVPVADEGAFERVVHAAFTQRRKQLRNSLVASGYPRDGVEAAAGEAGIDLARRGETLDLGEFAALAARLHPGP